jgi:hypothetical protein
MKMAATCISSQGESVFEYTEHSEETLSFPGAGTQAGGDVRVALQPQERYQTVA